MYLSEETEDCDLWRPLGRFAIIIFLILFFISCNKKSSNDLHKRDKHFVQDLSINDAKIKEAKYSDVPLPVGYDLISLVKNSDFRKKTDFICYVGNLPEDDVIKYYQSNMEQFGWEILDLSNEHEGLLFCNKPRRYCVVSVRKNDNLCKKYSKKNSVCLFIKNKIEEDEEKQQKDINSKGVSLEGLFG